MLVKGGPGNQSPTSPWLVQTLTYRSARWPTASKSISGVSAFDQFFLYSLLYTNKICIILEVRWVKFLAMLQLPLASVYGQLSPTIHKPVPNWSVIDHPRTAAKGVTNLSVLIVQLIALVAAAVWWQASHTQIALHVWPRHTFTSWLGAQSILLMTQSTVLQYIPRNMHTVLALLCFVVVIHWLIFPYPSGLLHWHCCNLTIAPVPAKQPWWIWINTSCEFIMNDCITTTKQSTTKPCAYFLGYTVYQHHQVWMWRGNVVTWLSSYLSTFLCCIL